MSYPNKKLERLKKMLTPGGDICEIEPDELLALLSRLEAAEDCAELLQLHQESGTIFDGDEEDDAVALQAVEAWMKAAGK